MSRQLQIIQADVRALPLAADCVDLVFASPPYEAARTYGIGFNLCGQDWVDWAVAGYLECLRVCRGLVAWVVEGQTRKFRWSAVPVLLMAALHNAGVHLRKPPVFHRVGIPGSGGPDWLRNDYEIIVCATSGGKLPWSDNTAMGHTPKYAPGGEMSYRQNNGVRRNQWGGGKTSGAGRKKNGTMKSPGRPSHIYHTTTMVDSSKADQCYRPPALANPGNVIKCKVGGGQMGHPLAHENEAPFPQALAEFFVRSFCPPGGVVFDPFSGSGTTAAAAIATGRRAVASDIRESQCQLTHRRCSDTQVEMCW